MKAYIVIVPFVVLLIAASIVVASYGDARFTGNRDEGYNFDNHNSHGESSKLIRKVDDERRNQQHRRAYSTGCSWGKTPEARWHPVYSAGWTDGYCRQTVDCNSPGFDTELACCKAAYVGQASGYCLSRLPNPPTTSPTDNGGLDVYYPDYDSPWLFAGCINRRPMPSGRPMYTTMLACCKGAYAGQVSGSCISMLPNPPTTTPTTSAQEADFWYPQYEISWSDAGCSNKLPLPYSNINDRPNYSTHESCCAAAYGGQVSRACICGAASPPLGCPGIVAYTATTTTTTISSTLTFSDIAVPADPTEFTSLVESLKLAIEQIVTASLGVDSGTLQEVRIISIGGVSVVQRMLRSLSRVLHASPIDVDFEIVTTSECSENCPSSTEIGVAVYNDVNDGFSDVDLAQSKMNESSDENLRVAVLESMHVDSDVDTTTSTTTTIGPPPTRRPTTPPTSKPTPPSIPTTSSPTVSPTKSPSTSSKPPTVSPSTSPTVSPTRSPTKSPSKSPTASPITAFPSLTKEDLMWGGNIANEDPFPDFNTEAVLHSESSSADQFGVVLTKHAFNEDDVDFQFDYIQESFDHLYTGYQAQLFVFFVEEGTYPKSLLQNDEGFADFKAATVGWLQSKIGGSAVGSTNTWFYWGSQGENPPYGTSTPTQHLELSLRIRRFEGKIETYYKAPGASDWTLLGQPLNIPLAANAPLQAGFRIKKEYRAYHNFKVTTKKRAGGPALPIADSPQPTLSPSDSPTTTPDVLTSDDLMLGGNGASPASGGNTEIILLQSDSDALDQFGVVLTTHAFNEPDVDFQVDYVETSYADLQEGYQSQLVIFYVEEGTYPENLLQNDNNFAEFEASTVGWLRSKVHSVDDYTRFYRGPYEGNSEVTISPKHLELSLRIRRFDNMIYTYYKEPGGANGWVDIGQPLAIPLETQSVPLQFGYRVKKEWRAHHHFSVITKKIAGGTPLSIPTRSPSQSPTETRTWINPGTNYKAPVCPSTLDRSSVSGNSYEMRGIGGGGAMSGLSISPWDDLWFVGTDMGTLFRSTDSGMVWYPVSHYEAKYHSRLVVSAPVGYTSEPNIVVHATCHEDVSNRDCVAQRSIDGGVTWNPIDITGGTRVDSQGNAVLDEIPLSWYGSLVQSSGIVFCIMFESASVYRSDDDGATWSLLNIPIDMTGQVAVGLYLDESAAPTRHIYFATSHAIYMWEDGMEANMRTIYAASSILLQSFTGARGEGMSTLMLSFVDNDVTACQGDMDSDCGFVYTFREEISTADAMAHSFTFTKTTQRGFRVASSRTYSDLIYVTGKRNWPSASGTQVWVGAYDSSQASFVFTLKFRQYPNWDSDKLDYSGVGLDVGYWDGGYYRWMVKANDSSVAGGTGNFFLHVTRNGGNHWESPFTEYADGCNTNDERIGGRRWRSTGLEMTSVRWLKFNPYKTNMAYASVCDIRMLRSDDGGSSWEITGGANTDPIFALNTVYDYDFAGVHTVFAVGGNFHDWPHGWYKNLRRGAGGVFVSFNSGDNWHRIGAEASSNCDDNFFNVDCSLQDDMVRQILSVHWDESVGGGTLYIGSQSAGVARLEGLNAIFSHSTIEHMQEIQWEWINSGLGSDYGRIIPEIKKINGNLYCLLTGNAPDYTNNQDVGLYQFDHSTSSWTLKKGVVNRPAEVSSTYDLWAYPTSFDVDELGNMWLVDIEANGNYLASGVWGSFDDGETWDRVQQLTFPYHITCVGNRVYASGARSISHIGNAGWGDGGAMYSDDRGATWQKNEDMPLLSNLNSVVVDPADETKVFYTFFGGGMMHGPRPDLPSQDWSPVSPLLHSDPTLLQFLPTIPSHADVSNQLYPPSSSEPNYPFKVHRINNFSEEAGLCNADGTLSVAMAGPSEICTADNCSGPDTPVGSEQCRAVINAQSIQLRSKFGTYWAKALGNPAWIQFIFPAIPDDSTNFYFTFELDDRYRPSMNGGNPCSAATSSYDCDLCLVPGPWDHSIGAGVHILWSAAGRNDFVITGPFELGTAFDARDFDQTHEAPSGMNYLAGEYPIVTFLTFSQYPAQGEVADPSSCSIDQSNEIVHSHNDKSLMIMSVSLMYRTELNYSTEPQLSRPRLYGTDAEWLAAHVQPFYDAPCDQDTAITNGGWFETPGYLSIKTYFDLAARGIISCDGDVESVDIGTWESLADYFTADTPDQRGGFRAFHLLRRLWACAESNGGDYSTCEYSESETDRLAAAVASKEMERFQAVTWTCGTICGGTGDPAFDLTTATQVGYFVTFFDVMVSKGTSFLTSGDAAAVQTTLQQMIESFIDTFQTGKWQLWNGNNWTPHLCTAALEWAIVFWHESNDLAVEVLQIVHDIMLHRDYYTDDGVYKEGVAEYGFMSIKGQMTMAALSQASFGLTLAAIDVERVQRLASYFISSMSSDGYTIDFGDSHLKRGWTETFSIIEAAIAPAVVNGGTVTEASIDYVQARAFSAAAYGSGGYYANPWRIRGSVLQFDSLSNLRTPPVKEFQPLGGHVFEIYDDGGYGRVLTPLLIEAPSSTPVCFADNKCIDPVLPSLWDNIPYSGVFLQARPNSFAHSEVDFGTFIWSAWGSRLISEFGYGTIATSVNQWDMRRYSYLDNNPSGHNTVVIREAFQAGSETINFSQLNYISGTLSPVMSFSDGSTCTLMDGSEVYGSARPDGWLDMMKRYACNIEGSVGSTLILDLIQTKAERTLLSLYGSQYGGPDFDEQSPAAQSLTIDEYFYTGTEADVTVADGVASEVLPFERTSSMKWCNHVDVELSSDSKKVILRPLCGIGAYRDADGMGVISGISLSSAGQFEYDGLVTSVNNWGQAHALKKRRFRFVTDDKVDSDGDVRAFMLSPSLASDPLQTPPTAVLKSCSDEQCGGSSNPIICSCVQFCVGTTSPRLKRVIVANGMISSIEDVGLCLCDTCLHGRVGHWTFDSLADGYTSSTDSTIIERGTSTPLVGENAIITGSGVDPPLTTDGKFGSALVIPAGTQNYAQMSVSGLHQAAPSNGVTGSIWLRPASNSFAQGVVWERKYNNFDLWTITYQNVIQCRVRDPADNNWHYAQHSIGAELDPSHWYHAVCTYSYTEQLFSLYLDGSLVVSTTVTITSFVNGIGDDGDMPLGVGNRPSSEQGNPGHSAGNSHFVGEVDDFVLWDRPLSSTEISLLHRSGVAAEYHTASPTSSPSTSPTTGSPTSSPTTSLVPTAPQLLWSDSSSWPSGSVPVAGDDVTIPAGAVIALDSSRIPPSGGSLGTLTVDGTVVNEGDTDFALYAETIIISETGTLQIGSESTPYQGHATIELTGAPNPSSTFERDEDNAVDNDGMRRAMRINGGSIIMHAVTPTVLKTKLNADANAGATALALADSVNWLAGDLIAVSTTDYYWGYIHNGVNSEVAGDPNFPQTEILTVASDTQGGNTVTLTSPLAHGRWGSMQYVTNTGMSLSPGTYDAPSFHSPTVLDERAEIVHLSRGIIIQGADDSHWQDYGFGAHVLVSGASSVAQIEGVSFLRGGQRRAMGRYPFHWHMLSAASGTNIPVNSDDHYLRRSTIVKSENRAVSIHGTSGVEIDTVFAVDILNHAYFFEDGSERGNTIINCVAMKVRNLIGQHLKEHDKTPTGFWLTNPDNTIVGNSASDVQGIGFWNAFSPELFGLSAAAGLVMNPASLKILAFDNNVAHGCRQVGMQTESPVFNEAGDTAPRRYAPEPDNRFDMNSNVIWKCNNGGYSNRVGIPSYRGWTVADNSSRDIFGAADQLSLIEGNLFIAQSLNNAHSHLDIPNQAWDFQGRRRGVASYHFSVDIRDITAIGYVGVGTDADSTPQITLNGQFVYAPGFIDLSDLYVTPVSLGTLRCPGWKLIDSNAGYHTPTMASPAPEDDPSTTDRDESLSLDGFPKCHGVGCRHWTLSGATWDPHGYWGPTGNYVLASPSAFFTYQLNDQAVAVPPGTLADPINGVSTPDTFFGLATIRPFTWNHWYDGSTGVAMTVDRLDPDGSVVDSLFIGDDCSSEVLHFRHYAVQRGGIYRLRLFTDTYSACTTAPEGTLGTQATYGLENAYRHEDNLLVGVPWPSATQANVIVGSWGGVDVSLSDAGMTSWEDIRDSSARAFWQDANDVLWVKYVGGVDPTPDPSDQWSDQELERPHMIRISSVS